MQLVHVELDQHARGLAAWEVWTVRDHAPFTSARDAHDAPGAAAALQSRAGAWTSREEIRVFFSGNSYLHPGSFCLSILRGVEL